MVSRTPTRALVRHATLSDYPSIMKIDASDYYGKRNYLAKMFFRFIESPYFRNYVCELDGKIIGYECVLIHDEGATIQLKAGRVNVGLRGKGFGRLMEDFMMKDLRTLPGVKNIMAARNLPSGMPDEWTVVGKQVCYESTADVPGRISPDPATGVQVYTLSQTDISSLFSCSSACRMLFPNSRLYFGTFVLGCLQGNVNFISNNGSVFASFKSPHQHQQECPDAHQMYDFKDIAFLSFAFDLPQPGENECIYVLSVYGDRFDHLQSHVQKHFSLIRTKQGPVTFRLVTEYAFPQDVVYSAIKSPFRELGVRVFRIFTKPFPVQNDEKALKASL